MKIYFALHIEGYGIPLGENFLDVLKKELDQEVYVIFVLSPNFYNSPISMCEMGATWMNTGKHVQMLIPPFHYQDIRGVFPNHHSIIMNDSTRLNDLQKTIRDYFEVNETVNISRWERKRMYFLNEIKSFIEEDAVAAKTKTTQDELQYILN